MESVEPVEQRRQAAMVRLHLRKLSCQRPQADPEGFELSVEFELAKHENHELVPAQVLVTAEKGHGFAKYICFRWNVDFATSLKDASHEGVPGPTSPHDE
jgi:hypothetical protein